MEIYGRDYGFKLTVGASADIARLCPDGDLSQLGQVLKGRDYAKTMGAIVGLICAMSKGHEQARAFREPGYKPAPLTRELLESLDTGTFRALEKEAIAAFVRDRKPTVEVNPEDNAKNGEGAGEAG